jgi:hypothetical protein
VIGFQNRAAKLTQGCRTATEIVRGIGEEAELRFFEAPRKALLRLVPSWKSAALGALSVSVSQLFHGTSGGSKPKNFVPNAIFSGAQD